MGNNPEKTRSHTRGLKGVQQMFQSSSTVLQPMLDLSSESDLHYFIFLKLKVCERAADAAPGDNTHWAHVVAVSIYREEK